MLTWPHHFSAWLALWIQVVLGLYNGDEERLCFLPVHKQCTKSWTHDGTIRTPLRVSCVGGARLAHHLHSLVHCRRLADGLRGMSLLGASGGIDGTTSDGSSGSCLAQTVRRSISDGSCPKPTKELFFVFKSIASSAWNLEHLERLGV